MSVAIFGHDGISINDILPDLVSQVLELIFIFTQHNTTQHTRTHQVEKISHTHTHTCVESMLCSRGRSSSVSESAEDARIGVASASHLHLIFLLIILLLAPTLHEEITNRRCDQIL